MPIKVQSNLPAIKVLENENIFVMPNEVALRQDIRPLKILILNLMPTKIATETQLLRLLGNSPLQVDIELLQMASHTSKNTSPHHLTTFYKTFDDVKGETFDGLIITGAPVEHLTRPSTSAGALRQVYIFTTELRSISSTKSSAEFTPTECSILPTG